MKCIENVFVRMSMLGCECEETNYESGFSLLNNSLPSFSLLSCKYL